MHCLQLSASGGLAPGYDARWLLCFIYLAEQFDGEMMAAAAAVLCGRILRISYFSYLMLRRPRKRIIFSEIHQ